MRLNALLQIGLLVPVMLSAGCAYDPSFAFPAGEGDIAAGRQAFIDHQCHACHSVAGIELQALAGRSETLLELGGATATVRSYAGLMTSIINPNHEISDVYRDRLLLNAELPLDSPMPMPHIDTMTVRQLIDMVEFLDSRYVLIDEYEYQR